MQTQTVTLRLTSQEIARLDERRGSGVSRSAFVRQLLRQSGPVEEMPTRAEALRLLAESAHAGKVAAQIALSRELRDQAQTDVWEWITNG